MPVTRTLSLAQELTVLANIIHPAPELNLSHQFSYFSRDIGERFAPHLKNATAQTALLATITAFRKRDVLPANAQKFNRNATEAVASILNAADAQGGLGKFGNDLYAQQMAFAAEDGADVFSVWHFPKSQDAARRKIYEDGLNIYAAKNPEACATQANKNLVNWYAFKNSGNRWTDAEIAQFRKLVELTVDKSLENTHAKNAAEGLRLASRLKQNTNNKIFEQGRDNSIHHELEKRKVEYRKTPEYAAFSAHEEKLKHWIQNKIHELAKTGPQAALEIALEIDAVDMSRPEYKNLPILTSEDALNSAVNAGHANKLGQQISWRLNHAGCDPQTAHCDKAHAAKISRALAAFYQGAPNPEQEAYSLLTAYMLTRDDADATRMLDRYQEIYVMPEYVRIPSPESLSLNPIESLNPYMPLHIAKETSNQAVEARALGIHEAVLKKAASINAGATEKHIREHLMASWFFNQFPFKDDAGKKMVMLSQSFARSWAATLKEMPNADHATSALWSAEQLLQECPGYATLAKAAIAQVKPAAEAWQSRQKAHAQQKDSEAQAKFDQAVSGIPQITLAQFLEQVGKDPEPEPVPAAA